MYVRERIVVLAVMLICGLSGEGYAADSYDSTKIHRIWTTRFSGVLGN